MQTIKRGVIAWWNDIRVSCENCGFVGRLEEKDKPSFDYVEAESDYYTIKCPTCSGVIVVGHP